MFNATLIGRLTRDPETKATAAGSAYTKFSIAVNNGKDKSGADKPATFVDCSVFGKTGEFVMSYARKGARVCISAAMEVGSYQNKNTGETMLSVSAMVDTVELIDWPDRDQAAPAQQGYQPQQPGYGTPPTYPPQGQYGVPPQGQQPPAYQQQGQYAAPPAVGQQAYPPQNQVPPQGYPMQNQGYPPQGQQPPAATPWANSPI